MISEKTTKTTNLVLEWNELYVVWQTMAGLEMPALLLTLYLSLLLFLHNQGITWKGGMGIYRKNESLFFPLPRNSKCGWNGLSLEWNGKCILGTNALIWTFSGSIRNIL